MKVLNEPVMPLKVHASPAPSIEKDIYDAEADEKNVDRKTLQMDCRFPDTSLVVKQRVRPRR